MKKINLQDKRENLRVFFIAFVLLIIVLTGLASSETVVSVSPQKQSVEENESFAVDICIEPDVPISGAQFDFVFNNSLVNVKEVQEKNALSQTGATTMFSEGTIDNQQGSITGVYSLILGKDTVTEPGILAAIDLTSAGRPGVCKLQLSNVIVSNPSGNAMPVKVAGGTVYIGDMKDAADNTDNSSGSETPAEEMPVSGGGGGIANGESYENIKLKEVSRVFVSKDNPVSYHFREAENPVICLNYTALRSVGFITASIEVLEDTSSLVSGEPEGIVYRNLNIWVGKNGYSTEENIGNPVISFKVSKAWMEENRVQASTVKLNRYNSNKWNPLPTVQTGEDSDYVLFESETPGFSPFAITGKNSRLEYSPEKQVPGLKEVLTIKPPFEGKSESALSSEEKESIGNEDQEERSYQAPAPGIFRSGLLFLISLMFLKRNRG